MDFSLDHFHIYESKQSQSRKEAEEINRIKKGPWSREEDSMLIHYVHSHGEGHWDAIARCSGLKRSGKSCRFRWHNYLRPNIRHGNLTLHEQILILLLRCQWGNRWSKIAQQLPGRTDNEVKNYWRTRVEKRAKKLRLDVNSKQFIDALRHHWIPQLLNQIPDDQLPILTTYDEFTTAAHRSPFSPASNMVNSSPGNNIGEERSSGSLSNTSLTYDHVDGDRDGVLNTINMTSGFDDQLQMGSGYSGEDVADKSLDHDHSDISDKWLYDEQSLDFYMGDLNNIWPNELLY